jgi:thiamine biosynthesis lipoprotein
MKRLRLIMGMPITVEVLDDYVTADDLQAVFDWFAEVDQRFSTYKSTSEVSRINRGELAERDFSPQMREVLAIGRRTARETSGFFNMERDGLLDPSGIVKGWAIQCAAELLAGAGYRDFYVDAGGDIQVAGFYQGRPWRVGIRNPFNRHENVKVLALSDRGVATSGTAIRGQHIYNPFAPERPLEDIVSLTVVGPNVLEADRFATAAFAMGRDGIRFIESLPEFEGYAVDAAGMATYTSGFEEYVLSELDQRCS